MFHRNSKSEENPDKISIGRPAHAQAADGPPTQSAVTVTCYRPTLGEVPPAGAERPVMFKVVPYDEWRKHYAKDAQGRYHGTAEPAEDCLLLEEDEKKWRGWDAKLDAPLGSGGADENEQAGKGTRRVGDGFTNPVSMQYASGESVAHIQDRLRGIGSPGFGGASFLEDRHSSVMTAGGSRKNVGGAVPKRDSASSTQDSEGEDVVGVKGEKEEGKSKWWKRKKSTDEVIS